ncbi:MAG: RelA/SpoT domain-containing protein [Candidatus Aminicenantes bacterium]|jgi:ppGpp synthetase/RelA/SpoT-type nucleotidyltranferase
MVEDLIKARLKGKLFAEHAVKILVQKLSTYKLCVTSEHKVEWRVKSEKAIWVKAAIPLKVRPRSSLINDFIGIRVLASHLGCLEVIEDIIKEWAKQLELAQIERENKFQNPDQSGYRAIHFDYRFLQAQRWKLPSTASVELQLTTKFQHVHGEISHRLYHKVIPSSSEEVRLFLCNLSDQLHNLDQQVKKFACQDY